MAIIIEEVTKVTDELEVAFQRLMPQLSSSPPWLGPVTLQGIVNSPCTVVMVAVDADKENQIVGSLTLVMFRIPTGLRAWIEDVVVDSNARGKGVGEILCEHAIAKARSVGAKTFDLTSRPSREAANRLYERVGFKRRESNIYRFQFS